jgi:hypothetical protein
MNEPEPDPRDDYDDRPGSPRLSLSPAQGRQHRSWEVGVAIGVTVGLVIVCAGWMRLSSHESRQAVNRMRSSNNLKQIGLAVHNYEDAFECLPHNTYSLDGKPLLSWRVHLLPYIEHDHIYRQFKLDEPWDSPNNIHLLNEKPKYYMGPGDLSGKPGSLTYYRGFSSPGTVFERRPLRVVKSPPNWWRVLKEESSLTTTGFKLMDVKDGLGNTILVVEAGEPVEWTKPDDLDASPGKPFPKMGGLGWRNGFQALMGDGSVRMLKYDTPEETLRGLVTHSGGEPVSPE